MIERYFVWMPCKSIFTFRYVDTRKNKNGNNKYSNSNIFLPQIWLPGLSSTIIAIVNLLCFVQFYVMLQFHHITSWKQTQIIYYMYDIFDLSILICQQHHAFNKYQILGPRTADTSNNLFDKLYIIGHLFNFIVCREHSYYLH